MYVAFVVVIKMPMSLHRICEAFLKANDHIILKGYCVSMCINHLCYSLCVH